MTMIIIKMDNDESPLYILVELVNCILACVYFMCFVNSAAVFDGRIRVVVCVLVKEIFLGFVTDVNLAADVVRIKKGSFPCAA